MRDYAANLLTLACKDSEIKYHKKKQQLVTKWPKLQNLFWPAMDAEVALQKGRAFSIFFFGIRCNKTDKVRANFVV